MARTMLEVLQTIIGSQTVEIARLQAKVEELNDRVVVLTTPTSEGAID